ncbi:MAG: hypothetical protein U0529_14250 [Thermoanaerobaculia bacterium]
MNGLTVGVNEELKEAEAALESRSAVAQGAFERVPEGQVIVNKGDHANAEEALAEGLTVAEVGGEAEVEDESEEPPEAVKGVEVDDDVAGLDAVSEGGWKTSEDGCEKDDAEVDDESAGAGPE